MFLCSHTNCEYWQPYFFLHNHYSFISLRACVRFQVYMSYYTTVMPSVQHWKEALPFLAKMESQELNLTSHLKHQKKSYLKNDEAMVLKILDIRQIESVNSDRQGKNAVGSGSAPDYHSEKVSGARSVTPGRVESTWAKEINLKFQKGQDG